MSCLCCRQGIVVMMPWKLFTTAPTVTVQHLSNNNKWCTHIQTASDECPNHYKKLPLHSIWEITHIYTRPYKNKQVFIEICTNTKALIEPSSKNQTLCIIITSINVVSKEMRDKPSPSSSHSYLTSLHGTEELNA